MRSLTLPLLLSATAAVASLAADGPEFNGKGELRQPANYREWVFLSSGLGMTYGPAATASPNPMFDNVFVNPRAWAEFKQTGHWPEGTVFVLEVRKATSNGSINKGGHFQTEIAAIEVAVKDSKRFAKSGWEYFDFGHPAASETAPLGAKSSCQACHGANGAVEQTFTQFYPVAMEIAKKKGTVRPDYKAQISPRSDAPGSEHAGGN